MCINITHSIVQKVIPFNRLRQAEGTEQDPNGVSRTENKIFPVDAKEF
jgi:hypothetical protein